MNEYRTPADFQQEWEAESRAGTPADSDFQQEGGSLSTSSIRESERDCFNESDGSGRGRTRARVREMLQQYEGQMSLYLEMELANSRRDQQYQLNSPENIQHTGDDARTA